jgi:5-methyltetrahydropteroyltriglutamate--homocysteine methyltransferase
VPTTEEVVNKIKSFASALPLEQLVINPDCGLKTRRWPETIAALKNMVEAAHIMRNELGCACKSGAKE